MGLGVVPSGLAKHPWGKTLLMSLGHLLSHVSLITRWREINLTEGQNPTCALSIHPCDAYKLKSAQKGEAIYNFEDCLETWWSSEVDRKLRRLSRGVLIIIEMQKAIFLACLGTLTLVSSIDSLDYGLDGFIQPVPLEDVELEKDSHFDKAVSLNREYLLGVDSDRLLKTFRFVPFHISWCPSSSNLWVNVLLPVHQSFMTRDLKGFRQFLLDAQGKVNWMINMTCLSVAVEWMSFLGNESTIKGGSCWSC